MAVRGLTIGIGADTSAFNKELKAMDKNIKSTSQQVGMLAKSLQFEWDATKFERAQKLAQEALEQTDVKVKAVRDRLLHLEKSGKVDTTEYARLQEELTKSEYKSVQLRKELEKLERLKLDQSIKKIENLGQGITKVGQALAPVSAAAAGILAGFAAIGTSAVKAADDVLTLAGQLNLSAESMQRWQYIAMQTDVSNQELQTAFQKTQAALADLASGASGPGANALTKLGISTEDASKGMEANIDVIIKRLSDIPDAVTQAGIANELFGDRLGAKLIPLLQAGGEGLAELTSEFEALGYMSNEQVNALAEFDNVMNRIKYSFANLKNQLGSALLPLMEQLAAFIEAKIIPAAQKLSEWIQGLSDGQLKFMMTTLALVAALAPALIIIGKMTTGITGLIKGLDGLKTALNFLAAHPIIAIIAVIIALIALLYNRNEEVRASIDALIATLEQLLGLVLSTLMPIINALVDTLLPIINGLLDAMAPIIKLIANALNAIFKVLKPIIDLIFSLFSGAFEFYLNAVIDWINIIIKGLNLLGKVLGFTIDELDHVSFKASVQTDVNGPSGAVPNSQNSPVGQAESALKTNYTAGSASSIVNNDYSNKDIRIEVVVQNYGEELDVDSLVREINLKLAQEL